MKKRILIVPVVAVLTAFSANAATLNTGARNLVSENNQNFNLSVFPGSASYDDAGRSVTGPVPINPTLGDGTVLAYNFFHSPTETIVSYAESGSRISNATTAAENINGAGENWSNVWTTTDPAGFTSTKDFDSVVVPNTFARAAEVDGSIDISGLTSGIVYIPHGTFINQWTLTLTMTGAGQTDIVAIDTQSVNGPGTNMGWITDFSFTNEGQYDSIAYNYSNADRDGSRARFMGVILDGVLVPEPSAAALFGLAGIGCLLRRRRR